MSEGVKLDTGKIRTDLLPFDALESVSAVLAHGATKYEARNWEKGFAWGRLLGAAMRHLFSWAGGQDIDPESGLPHLSHAACCVLMLLALTIRGIGADDRTAKVDRQIPVKTTPEAGAAEAKSPFGICLDQYCTVCR